MSSIVFRLSSRLPIFFNAIKPIVDQDAKERRLLDRQQMIRAIDKHQDDFEHLIQVRQPRRCDRLAHTRQIEIDALPAGARLKDRLVLNQLIAMIERPAVQNTSG